ncbi:MAG: hypothetical protein OEY20_01480 [Gemmatimonadota bacterium]|nr:hypothetical protein [Gemmatimonadota bacterium]MDH4350421.1 hypothetical protein [Gemmatimonadota bacterium]MDH5195903.1 hypothetical protein [Gemmatimonadota bacterium]
MHAISLRYRRFSLLLGAVVTACGSDTTLAPARFENVLDTTVLYALTGTPIGTPSGFDGVQAAPVRTDLNVAFDFAVDITPMGSLQLLPTGALGYFPEPGLLVSFRTFDLLVTAPLDGYVLDSALTVETGGVFVLRSRSSSDLCTNTGALPRYGKFHVLAIDAAQRNVTLEFLVNRNCGYRGLEPGLPDS